MFSSSLFPSLARGFRTLLVLASTLLLTGCELWSLNGHQSTFAVEGPVARAQLEVFYVTLWVTLAIFVAVGGVLAYATVKFRARSESDEHAEPPEQSHGNPLVEMSLIGASVLALVIIAIPTLKNIWYTYDVPAERRDQMYEITVTGWQWWFQFEYPSEQIEGAGSLRTANELVIPVGRPVRVNLRTRDVIHAFWVPKLAGKVDMMPNRGNHLWLEAEKAGYYWGQCAEYCGDSHAVMRFRVIALEEAEFNAWLAAQKAPSRTPGTAAATPAPVTAVPQFASYTKNQYGFSSRWDPGAAEQPLDLWRAHQRPDSNANVALIDRGAQLVQEKLCMACHTIRGHPTAFGASAPDLTHVGSRTTIAGGLLENTPDQLARWLRDPLEVKPGNLMGKAYGTMGITLAPDDINALVAYLGSLK